MRAFIAILLPAPIRQSLAEYQDALQQAVGTTVRWTPADQLHMTLRFLGECEAERVTPLRALVRTAASGTAPMDVAWQSTVGAFPQQRLPRVLWTGLAAGAEAVIALARRAEDGVMALGFQPEPRVFHPHVTLGRVVQPAQARAVGERLTACRARLQAPPCRLDTIALVESQLTPQGAVHTVLERAILRKGVV